MIDRYDVKGKPADAERAMREHLHAYPRDLMVLQRLPAICTIRPRGSDGLAFAAST